MNEPVRLSLEDATELAFQALLASKTSEANALPTARALVAAEADGQRGHGLSRVPSYAAQTQSGKVDGHAEPIVEQPRSALLRIDANSGFAYPALDIACAKLPEIAESTGIAGASIYRSHHLGQAGAHAERLAAEGLVAIVFSNSPGAMPFWGGKDPKLGTNPIAFAAPLADQPPLVIDLALSKVARGKIMAAEREGRSIPDDWALDTDGRPTTDPTAAMAGTMLPIGDAKGAALALMVELLAAALTGSNFGFEASSFFSAAGDPPHIGHAIIAIDPDAASGGSYAKRIATMVAAIDATDGARLPGTSRLEHRQRAADQGLHIPAALHAEIEQIIAAGAADG